MAGLFFSKSFLEQFILHAQLGKHFLEPSVLILNLLHLADHRSVHPPKLRPQFVERCIAHAVFTAQICHRNTALGLAQDRKSQWIAVSVGFHPKSTHAVCRENSTCEAP